MGGRLCQICASVANLKLAAEMITAGASDHAVASKIGGINRMTVSRHRRNHIEAPAKALVEAANKGRSVVEDREQTLAAVAAGDEVAAFVGLAGIVSDLKGVRDRLEGRRGRRAGRTAPGDRPACLAAAQISRDQRSIQALLRRFCTAQGRRREPAGVRPQFPFQRRAHGTGPGLRHPGHRWRPRAAGRWAARG